MKADDMAAIGFLMMILSWSGVVIAAMEMAPSILQKILLCILAIISGLGFYIVGKAMSKKDEDWSFSKEDMMKSFRIFDKGFHLKFPNGVTLSTILREGHATDHVEVAIWDKYGFWLTKKMSDDVFHEDLADDVIQGITIEKWLKVVDWCKKYREVGK